APRRDGPVAARGAPGVDDGLAAQAVEQRVALRSAAAGHSGQKGGHAPIVPHPTGRRGLSGRRRGYDDAMPTTSARPQHPRPARPGAAISAAARELAVADGGVTVNALAKRAGVSRAAFYSRSSGLDDLMGAMLSQMLDTAWARGTESKDRGEPVHQRVRFGYGMLAVHLERHHPFLRRALDWKFSHRTYMILVDTMVERHGVALG